MRRSHALPLSLITFNPRSRSSDAAGICRSKQCLGFLVRQISKDSTQDSNETSTRESPSNHSPVPGEISRSGPILIKRTPRSAAAAKMRTKLHESNTETKLHDADTGTTWGMGEISNSHKTYTDLLLPSVGLGENKFELARYGEESLYTLVLLRHGESEWNRENRFTGWSDVNLTKKGEMEARTAGRLLFENGIEIDHAFTSVLKRASFSCNMCLNMAEQHWVPVTKTWRLNERHYGVLQGYHKVRPFRTARHVIATESWSQF